MKEEKQEKEKEKWEDQRLGAKIVLKVRGSINVCLIRDILSIIFLPVEAVVRTYLYALPTSSAEIQWNVQLQCLILSIQPMGMEGSVAGFIFCSTKKRYQCCTVIRSAKFPENTRHQSHLHQEIE